MVKKKKCKGFKKVCSNKATRNDLCSNCIGEKFRIEVKDLLKDIFEIIPSTEELISGSKIDVYFELTIHGKIKNKFYIECKDLKDGIDVNNMNKFINTFITFKFNNQVDMGMIISKNKFSPNAKANARLYNITTLTHEDLIQIKELKEKQESQFDLIRKTYFETSELKPAGNKK